MVAIVVDQTVMKRSGAGRVLVLLALCTLCGLAAAQPPGVPRDLRTQAHDAVDRALRYLRDTQARDGSWSGSLLTTALALRAFLENHHRYRESDGAFITRPVGFLLSHRGGDGAFVREGEDAVATTAASLYALRVTGNAAHAEAVIGAQRRLLGWQRDGDPDAGGFSASPGVRPALADIPDVLEALRAAVTDGTDPVWDRSRAFLLRHRDPGSGGFLSAPGDPEARLDAAVQGLLGLMYAGARPDEPAVVQARAWLEARYALDPGEGIDPFRQHAAVSRVAYSLGLDALGPRGSPALDWREALIQRLVATQAPDGGFSAGTPRDRARDTARAVQALVYAAAALPRR